jgi:hypothetical protein
VGLRARLHDESDALAPDASAAIAGPSAPDRF